MKLTERQGNLLNRIVKEYIDSAEPVSSQLLEKKYNLKISPATVRNEMQKLTDAGFIFQPHTSAGRVPTDKAYRFFVNDLIEKGFSEKKESFKTSGLIEKEMGDTVKLLQSLTKNLASFSSSLALGYLFDEDILLKEGWEGVLQEPEFKETSLISEFADVIKKFEKEVEDMKVNSEIKVFIGKENPFSKTKEFSIIISGCQMPHNKKGVLAIAGPKRMSYEKNINSLNSLIKNLERI